MSRLSRFAWLLATAALVAPASAQAQLPPIESVALSPRLPTDADEVSLLIRSGTGEGCTYLDFPEQASAPPLAITPLPIIVRAAVEYVLVTCPGGSFEHEVRLGKLEPGSYVLQIYADANPPGDPEGDVLLHVEYFDVTASRQQVSLHNGRFVVEAEWIGGPAAGEPLHAVTLGEEAGYFWSFASTNVELTVKVLDGALVNGHMWVFLAPMTSLGLEVTVFDTRSGCSVPGCPSQVYTLEPGKPDTLFDLDAFSSAP
jgi:hypothetical protein